MCIRDRDEAEAEDEAEDEDEIEAEYGGGVNAAPGAKEGVWLADTVLELQEAVLGVTAGGI